MWPVPAQNVRYAVPVSSSAYVTLKVVCLVEKPSHLGIPDHREGYAEPLSPIHETAAGFEYSDPSPSLAESAVAESRRVNEESQRKEKRDEWKERDKLRDSLLADLTRPVACVHGAPTTPQYTAAAVPLVTCIGITPEPSSSSGLDETVIPKLRMSSETPVVETIKQRNKLSETAQRSAAESSGFHLVNNNMVATSAPASSRAGSSPDSFVSGKTSLDLDSGSRLSVLKVGTSLRRMEVRTEREEKSGYLAFWPK